MMFKYFVFYTYNDGQNQGFGNVDVDLSSEISSIEDIREVEKRIGIAFNHSSPLVISNYQLFSTMDKG